MTWWTDEQMRRARRALEEAQPLINIADEAARSGKPIAPTKAIGEQAASAKIGKELCEIAKHARGVREVDLDAGRLR